MKLWIKGNLGTLVQMSIGIATVGNKREVLQKLKTKLPYFYSNSTISVQKGMLCEGYLKVFRKRVCKFLCGFLANSVTNENPKTHVKIEMYKKIIGR